MIEKYIKLLNVQVEKINDKSFDLKSWKIATILIIDRIFGENSKKADEIQGINFDMSSWALRDTLAKQSNIDACKQKGKSILEAIIAELEIIGLPDDINNPSTLISINILLDAMKDELKGSQYREIIEITKLRKKISEKQTIILDKLKTYGSDVSENILAAILSNEEFKKKHP